MRRLWQQQQQQQQHAAAAIAPAGSTMRDHGVLVTALNAARLANAPSCDVAFSVDGQEMGAHRLVLSATCPVFERMFAGDFFKERDGRVDIQGVTREAFDKFLEFLYTEEVKEWADCEVELLELSDRYLVTHLKAECESRLMRMSDAVALIVLRQTPFKFPTEGGAHQSRAARTLVTSRTAVASVRGWAAFRAACPILADVLDVAQEEVHRGGAGQAPIGVRESSSAGSLSAKESTPCGSLVGDARGVLARGLNAARESSRLCDVVFVVEGQELPAHRIVLAASSPLFFRKFSSEATLGSSTSATATTTVGDAPAAPHQQQQQQVLVEAVEGVSKVVVDKFLEFVYTENVADWAGLEMNLLDMAHRYEVEHLRVLCERRLEQSMDVFTALSALRQAADRPFIGAALRRAAARRAVRTPAVADAPPWAEFEAACAALAEVIRIANEELPPSLTPTTTPRLGSAAASEPASSSTSSASSSTRQLQRRGAAYKAHKTRS